MLEVLLIIVSIALIIVCLLQTGKTDGIVNALTGQSSNLFAQQKKRCGFSSYTYYCRTRYCILCYRNSY